MTTRSRAPAKPGRVVALRARVLVAAALLGTVALAARPAFALERQEAYLGPYPPSFGDYCWERYDLLPALSDTLCWDLIWDWSGFRQGDVVGLLYQPDGACAADCWQLHILYLYFPQAIDGPGDEVEVSLWCADEQGCPTGEPIDRRTIDPERWVTTVSYDDLWLDACATPTGPRFVITLCWLTDSGFPHLATDNIESVVNYGCTVPPGSPRPDLDALHSRIFTSQDCAPACPWTPFEDGADHLELVWQFALTCGGVIPAERTSWGRIKARYDVSTR